VGCMRLGWVKTELIEILHDDIVTTDRLAWARAVLRQIHCRTVSGRRYVWWNPLHEHGDYGHDKSW